ncbi:MAG: purple acid phosphatase family protein [Burkholderiales bacterium]
MNDATAADGVAVRHPNAGAAKITRAIAQPVHYFEITFSADADVPYQLWLRGRAQSNHWSNDSVFVQFADSVNATGAAMYQIGTTSALEVNLEDCSGCGLSGWGWQDTAWGVGVPGAEVLFALSGTHRMRVQTREDGFTIDQIVLSPQRYLTSSPGALKNDTTIVPQGGQTLTVVRRPYLQQMTSHRVVAVWATREGGTPQVRLSGSPVRTVTGTSRLVPASRNGLGYDYYHHEVPIGGLSPATSYAYEASVADVGVASSSFRTAPSTGTGGISFVAFGDSGTGSTAQRQLATLMANDTFDLSLHTGDMAYGTTSGTGDATYRTYHDWFFDIYAAWLPSRPFFPSEGNHDSRPSNGDGTAYLDVFTLPANGATSAYPDHAERFYSFDYGPVHFVALDTEFAFQSATRRAEQLSWLEADLAATSQPWKLAFFHRSPYSAGGEHGSDLAVRAAFAPLFEQYDVRMVLSSHEHDYERTQPIRSSSTGTPVTYVVTGGGGGPLYPAGTAEWTAYSSSRHHYVRVEIADCALTLRAIGLNGSPFDTTVISRCQAGGAEEVVLYGSEAPVRAGAWGVENDSTAAGGRRIRHPDAGAAKVTTAAAQPAHFFEMTFTAQAGIPYRLWLRSKADRNYWGHDSVFAQFDRSVNASGAAQFRIGTTGGAAVNLEECSGCGLSGWGWEDNGWGRGVSGPQIFFAQTGTQRIRIQTREDGLAVDQIVLSPGRYLNSSPGALKNDTTILTRP